VCLPCAHAGGALVVRHAGHTVTYDWSTTDKEPPAIRWAAFYSDCEHEVLKVTAGHRVTLTYNLYAVPHRDRVEGKTESLDVTGLPLYKAVKDALDNYDFLPNGVYPALLCNGPHKPLSAFVVKQKAAFSAVIVIIGIRTPPSPRRMRQCFRRFSKAATSTCIASSSRWD
jgi:hypothetical protein